MSCKNCQNVKVIDPASAPVAPVYAPPASHAPKIPPQPAHAISYASPTVTVPPTFTAPPPTLSSPAPAIHLHTPKPIAPAVPKIVFTEPPPAIESATAPPQSIVIGPKQAAPKSYLEIQIPPAAAPDVQTLRNSDFKFTLVEIDAANVIKGFCVPPAAPPAEACPDCSPETQEPVCLNPCAEKACGTQGHELGHCWIDAKPVHEMLLLGRVGRYLSHLLGEGVLWLGCNGMVKAIKDVPLRVSHLWHQWYKPTPTAAPIIGQPMPFPYQVIADLDGNPYVIQGLAGEDSITVWDHIEQQFFQKPVTDFPLCVRHKLGFSPTLELVGFDPLSPSGNPADLRCLKRLEGEGMIWFRKIPTAPDVFCDCGTCDPVAQVQDFTTIAEFIPNPPADCSTPDCPSILAFTANGPRWVNAADLECLRGAPGTPGTDGVNGQDGEPVTIATYNACTNCPPVTTDE